MGEEEIDKFKKDFILKWMKDRVTSEVPEAEGIVYITNFHSFSYSLLRAYGNVVDISRKFTVIGEIEKEVY